MKTEMQHAWELVREFNEARAAGEIETARLAISDLEGFGKNTECASVRALCRSTLSRVTTPEEDVSF